MATTPKRKMAAAKKAGAAPKRKIVAVKKRAAAPKRKKAAAKKRAAAPKRKKAAAKKRAVAPKRRKAAVQSNLRHLLASTGSLLSALAELLERELGETAAPKRKRRKKKAAAKKQAAAPKRKKVPARKPAAVKRKLTAPKRKRTMGPVQREAIRRGMLIEGCEVLTKTFLRGSAHGQLRSVHRDRSSNKRKVAEFEQLIAKGVVNLHDGTLTRQDFAKLEQLGIKVPPKSAGSSAAAPKASAATRAEAELPQAKQSGELAGS